MTKKAVVYASAASIIASIESSKEVDRRMFFNAKESKLNTVREVLQGVDNVPLGVNLVLPNEELESIRLVRITILAAGVSVLLSELCKQYRGEYNIQQRIPTYAWSTHRYSSTNKFTSYRHRDGVPTASDVAWMFKHAGVTLPDKICQDMWFKSPMDLSEIYVKRYGVWVCERRPV